MWNVDFTKMTISYTDACLDIAVRDGKIGWFCYDDWFELPDEYQQAYSKWLNEQIYGEDHG